MASDSVVGATEVRSLRSIYDEHIAARATMPFIANLPTSVVLQLPDRALRCMSGV